MMKGVIRTALEGSLIPALVLSIASLSPSAFPYQEAPMLAERVARGELPPVDERLPDEPAVVEPVHEIGQYGGSWRRITMGATDIQLSSRMGYEPLVRWDRTGRNICPGLASSWEVLDDGRRYVFHLRPGMKWSDGHPVTSEDFMFWFDDVAGNTELMPVWPAWLQVNGQRPTISAPDEFTLVLEFPQPYGIFLDVLCHHSNSIQGFLPKHYMRQFHPRYADRTALEALARERGLPSWARLFALKADYQQNPELPSWRPFVLTVPLPSPRVVATRNPYYWKIDPAGNQLPYIDEVVFTDTQNVEIANLRAMTGLVDFQARRIDPANYGLFMANRQRGGYRVLCDPQPSPILCYVNQYSKDEELRPLLQNRDFRIALSLAINREELIDLIYNGLAVPSRGVASPLDPFFLPEYETLYREYDPDTANRLLDEAGLKQTKTGIRTLPSGKPFRQILNVYPSETGTSTELWQLVADYWREVGLDFVVKTDAPMLASMQVMNGNSDFYAYSTSGLHWIVDPQWYVPWLSSSFFAPLYGRYVFSGGKDAMAVKPSPEFQRLLDWYLELRATTNPERRMELGHKILAQWAEECYAIGVCRNSLVTIVSNRFKNVPGEIIHDWRVQTPGYIGIEQFYIDSRNSKSPDADSISNQEYSQP